VKAQPPKDAGTVEQMALESRLIEIVDRRRALERRLDDGYIRIDEALRAGTDVTAWEDFWLALLADYEHVCDEPRRAA
jgi:hypothetical protein